MYEGSISDKLERNRGSYWGRDAVEGGNRGWDRDRYNWGSWDSISCIYGICTRAGKEGPNKNLKIESLKNCFLFSNCLTLNSPNTSCLFVVALFQAELRLSEANVALDNIFNSSAPLWNGRVPP